MFPAMLFSISIVALSQFALFYWRAMLAGAAEQPVSDRVLEAAHVENGEFTGRDFATLVKLHDMTPDLNPGTSGLGFVRLYYRVVDGIGSFVGSFVPAVGMWSQREAAVCARYAAVVVDRRLQANLAMAASMRSC
jgi:hypothetical protein